MNLIEEQTAYLVQVIKESEEYIQYQELLKKVMHDGPLYDKINEFRRKSISIQMTCDDDLLEEESNLCLEYNTLLQNTLVAAFLAAEQKYCKMIRIMNNQITDNLGIDIDYLED